VREGQLTNSYSANASPMIDDLIPLGTTPSFLYQNVQPTGVRDTNGNVLVAWASDRGTFVPSPGTPAQALTDSQLRIYLATLQGKSPSGSPPAAGSSPLKDLNAFIPGASKWFAQQSAISPFPAPAQENALFNIGTGETLIPQTEQFHYPSLPSLGFLNPLASDPPVATPFPAITMAFVGDAQIQTPSGRQAESRIMAASVAMDVSGNVTAGTPVALESDAQRMKGRPAVVQLANNQSIIFYPTAGAGVSGLDFVTFDPTASTFGPVVGGIVQPQAVQLPGGIDSVTAVSAVARNYQGAATASPTPLTSIIELTITARLRGRPNTEVFFVRMRADGANLGTIVDVSVITPEILTREPEPVLFRSAGVAWDDTTLPQLWYSLPGNAPVNLLDTSVTPTPYVIDPASGVIIWSTSLGKVFLDPSMGTVRFASPPPSRAILQLVYQPQYVRLSQGTQSGYTMPSTLFDSRLVGDVGFWARPDGTKAQSGDPIRTGRTIAMYSRAAAGGGQAARPLMTTLRPGIQLPLPIATDAGGNVLPITVNGVTRAVSFWQVDPAQGRIYFTSADEDNTVSISYTGRDSSGNTVVITLPAAGNPPPKVGLLIERAEDAVPIDKAINESNVTTFLDPFEGGRPNLFWMIWSSTRLGGSDLYFQTLSPRYAPAIGGP